MINFFKRIFKSETVPDYRKKSLIALANAYMLIEKEKALRRRRK